MTSRERWQALVRGEQLDRVPCLQFILGHTAVVAGKPIGAVYDDARASIACQRDAMELYGYDGLILHGWANAGGAEFGGDVEYPYRHYTGAPMMKRSPVQNEAGRQGPARARRCRRGRHRAHRPRVLPAAVRARHALHGPGRLAAHLGRVGLR